jgi:hypothetical protein
VQLTQLRYDASQALAARGIIPWRADADGPRAFPTGFVADPPSRW